MTGNISECKIISLPKITSVKGNLTPIYSGEHVPFDIERVYYLYDIPGGESRGGHAHKRLQQLLVAAMGSFDVIVDDGREKRSFSLNRAYNGLYIPRLIWREIVNCSSGAICLVLASMKYEESDYYRDYTDFKMAVRR